MSSSLEAFWEGIPNQVRDNCKDTVPSETLETRLAAEPAASTVEEKLALLESIIASELENAQPADSKQKRSLLFTLAEAQSQQGKHTAAEASWRRCLHENKPDAPDLAALNNLGGCLLDQKKYYEAEVILWPLVEVLKLRIGETSQQYVGCLRMLGKSIAGQGRKDEAREVFAFGKAITKTMPDKAVGNTHFESIETVEKDMVVY